MIRGIFYIEIFILLCPCYDLRASAGLPLPEGRSRIRRASHAPSRRAVPRVARPTAAMDGHEMVDLGDQDVDVDPEAEAAFFFDEGSGSGSELGSFASADDDRGDDDDDEDSGDALSQQPWMVSDDVDGSRIFDSLEGGTYGAAAAAATGGQGAAAQVQLPPAVKAAPRAASGGAPRRRRDQPEAAAGAARPRPKRARRPGADGGDGGGGAAQARSRLGRAATLAQDAAQRQAAADAPRRAALAQPIATSGVHSKIDDPALVYELISNPLQDCQGGRPHFVQDDDQGKIYVERSNGEPGKLHRPRRGRGLDTWKQGDFLWMRPVPGVSYGPDGRGSVWVRANYGTVDCRAPAAGAAAGAAAAAAAAGAGGREITTYKTHIFDLYYFNNGGPRGRVSEELQSGGALAKSHSTGVMADASWVQGTLWHFRERFRGSPVQPRARQQNRGGGGGGGGGGAQLQAAPPVTQQQEPPAQHQVVESMASTHRVAGRVDMSLDGQDGARNRWIQFNDAEGRDVGAIQLSDGGLHFTGTSGDFAEFHLVDPAEAAADR
jgi:hypothetical protein